MVLSCGGARGAAHIGVLQVMDELHIPVDYISGTSMSSIIAGPYAMGLRRKFTITFVATLALIVPGDLAMNSLVLSL